MVDQYSVLLPPDLRNILDIAAERTNQEGQLLAELTNTSTKCRTCEETAAWAPYVGRAQGASQEQCILHRQEWQARAEALKPTVLDCAGRLQRLRKHMSAEWQQQVRSLPLDAA